MRTSIVYCQINKLQQLRGKKSANNKNKNGTKFLNDISFALLIIYLILSLMGRP